MVVRHRGNPSGIEVYKMKLTKTCYLVALIDLVNFLQVSLIPAEQFHVLLSNGAAYAMASLNGVEPRGEIQV